MKEFERIIMCVDDDPLILQMLSFQLNRNLNPEINLIECCDDPKLVLECIEELPKDPTTELIILTDYQMPEMNGGQLVSQIKEKYPNSRCIMLSGQANESVVQDLVDSKKLELFIHKPWNEEGLLRAIISNSHETHPTSMN